MFGEKYKLFRGSRNAQVIAAAVTRVAIDGQVVSTPPAVQDAMPKESSPAAHVADLDWMDTVNVSASVGLGFEDPLASLGLAKLPPIPVRSETGSVLRPEEQPMPSQEPQLIRYTLPQIHPLEQDNRDGIDGRKRLHTPEDYKVLERELNASGKVPAWLKNPEEIALAKEYLNLRSGQTNVKGWAGL